MGVLCGTPEADEIVCDLGGGSLELVTIEGGGFGDHVTLPLGLLRLAEARATTAPSPPPSSSGTSTAFPGWAGAAPATFTPSAAPGAPWPGCVSPRPSTR